MIEERRLQAFGRVDALSTNLHYLNRMRRIWLSIFVAFALTASGVANAMAAQACPMQAAASAAAHDCCPDGENSDQDRPRQHEMDGCLMGMACRTAPAVAPTLAPVVLPTATIAVSQPIASEPAKPSGPLQELFRPPRTI